MKKLITVLAILTIAIPACALTLPKSIRLLIPSFYENFNGSTVNYSKWYPHMPWGDIIINDELQAYTQNNFIVSDGTLKIQAREEQAYYAGQLMDYTSGVITSYFTQTYGRWVARIKMPSTGIGYWPAFWIIPAEGGSQQTVLIAEWFGAFPVFMTVAYAEQDGTAHYQYPQGNFAGQWHVYETELRATFCSVKIDGVEVLRWDGAVQAIPMRMILNFAIASQDPIGPPDDETPFPANFEIDYIVVYP